MKNKSAFTLVEVLLSAMILSMVSIAAYRVFAVAVKANERVDQRLQSSLKILSTLHSLETDMGRIVRSSLTASFRGNADELSLLVGDGSDAHIVRYRHNEKGDLTRVEERAGKMLEETMFTHDELKRSGFSFGYLSGDTGGVLWREIWKADDVPFAVRWTAQISRGGRVLLIERTIFIPQGEWGLL